MTEGGGGGGKTKREKRKHRERQRRKQGHGGRQEDRGGQRKPVGAQEDCDHASWISISKQNKYSPSLLLLVRSSHKPFQVPCRPFPHRDLYLLASSRLGSPSLPLISSTPHGSFLSSPHFFFFCFISPCISPALALHLHQVLLSSSVHHCVHLTNLPSPYHCVSL